MGLSLDTIAFKNVELLLKDIEAVYPAEWATLLAPQWLGLRNTSEVYGLYITEVLL